MKQSEPSPLICNCVPRWTAGRRSCAWCRVRDWFDTLMMSLVQTWRHNRWKQKRKMPLRWPTWAYERCWKVSELSIILPQSAYSRVSCLWIGCFPTAYHIPPMVGWCLGNQRWSRTSIRCSSMRWHISMRCGRFSRWISISYEWGKPKTRVMKQGGYERSIFHDELLQALSSRTIVAAFHAAHRCGLKAFLKSEENPASQVSDGGIWAVLHWKMNSGYQRSTMMSSIM